MGVTKIRLAMTIGGWLLPIVLYGATTEPAATRSAATEPVWANLPGMIGPNGTVTSDEQPRGRMLQGPGLCPAVVFGTRVFRTATMKVMGPPLEIDGLAEKTPMGLSADGKLLAACPDGVTLVVANTSNGKVVASIGMTSGAGSPSVATGRAGDRGGIRGMAGTGSRFGQRGRGAAFGPGPANPMMSAGARDEGSTPAPLSEETRQQVEGPISVAFAGGDLLVTATRSARAISVWSVSEKKLLRTISTADVIGDRKQITVSPNGHWVAVQIHDGITLYDVRTGKQAAVMQPPSGHSEQPGSRPAPGTVTAAATGPAPKVFDMVDQLLFSDDSRELAATGMGPTRRGHVVVWDTTGKVVFDERVMGEGSGHITWLPDGSGWITETGQVYLRSVKIPVMELTGTMSKMDVMPVSQDKVVTYETFPSPRAQTVSLPWDAVTKTVAAAPADTAAPVRLGQGIALVFTFQHLRGDAQETERQFTRILRGKLAARGLTVDAGSAVKLKVDYEEKAGDTLPIYEAWKPGDPTSFQPGRGIFHDKETGQSATLTVGTIHVQLLDASGKVQLDRSGEFKSALSYQGKVDDGVLRGSTLSQVEGLLTGLAVPSYVPSNAQNVSLPVYVIIRGGALRAADLREMMHDKPAK